MKHRTLATLWQRISAAALAIVLWPTLGLTTDAGLPAQSADAVIGFRAGFIRPPFPYDARVSQITGDNQTTGNKRLLGSGEQLFLEATTPHEVSPGDLYTVYRRVRKVFHPQRGEYLGDLIMVIAIVKVTKISPDKITAAVVRSFDAILTGDGVKRLTPAPPEGPAPADRTAPEGTGLIIELPPGQFLVGEGSIVYIDWGREEGLRSGDRLSVFRVSPGLPSQMIGEVQVAALEDRTAAVRIVRSKTPFLRGDRVAFKERTALPTAVSSQPQKPESVTEELDRLTKQSSEASAQAGVAGAGIAGALTGGALAEDLDRLVERLDYQSGDAMPVGPDNEALLVQISDLLRQVPDKQLVIEGHTDNVEIGPKLKKLFRDNQELSNARAANMRRYLIEQGAFDAASISTIGFADAAPLASNQTEEGRNKNRRIKIVLQPKREPVAIQPRAEDVTPPIEPEPQPMRPEPTSP